MTGQAAISRMLLDCGAVRFGTFTLASGQHSDVYVDIKHAWTDPARLRRLGEAIAERVRDEESLLAGMELGAVPLVVAAALATGRRFVIVRKAAKGHGTNRRYEGEVPTGARCLVIEDVATTGGSLLETVGILREAGARVDRALVIVDREGGAKERLAALGVSLEGLTTLGELRGARS